MIDATLRSFALNLEYVRGLTSDLDSDELCVQPPGHPCHGAWTIGHLAFSCQAIGEEIGLTHWFDASTAALFRPGSRPVADPGVYPDLETLHSLLLDGEARVEAAVRALGAPGMAAPLPDVRHRKVLPTVGHVVVYSCCAHAALHGGLLTAWRKALGKGGAPPFYA